TPKNVERHFARGYEVVRNDSPMASPPDRLRAHDGAAPCLSQFAQPREARTEVLAHGVVRVVVKALVLPKRVHLWGHVGCPATQTSQCGDVLVSDLRSHQGPGKPIRVVLWIGARPRDGPHVDDETDIRILQQAHERLDRPGRMPDGKERVAHASTQDASKACRRSSL